MEWRTLRCSTTNSAQRSDRKINGLMTGDFQSLYQSLYQIEQGVRQGCIISPHLFNIYAETIMRNALENFEGSISIEGHKITNLRYADDVVLISGSLEELQILLKKVKTESEKAGLFLGIRKTKVMKIQRNPTENG